MRTSQTQTQRSPVFALFILVALTFAACETRLQIPSSTNAPDIQAYEFEATGEDFLISALEEVQAIADWSESFQNGPDSKLAGKSLTDTRMILAKTATDTVYIYGQIIPGGYGAVVTERYAHPKGLLLITIRKTYGKGNGHVVTETKRYASYADHLNDNPQQTNVTEMYGTQTDTIVTHVLRNGTLQTYTFRLPVITRVVNPQDGSIRITSRYASNGKILSKVTDGEGNLVQLRSSYGQSDGSTVTRTEYPDGSWTQVRTHGEADGTVTRETTSGPPSLGSGVTSPTSIPRPVMSMWMPPRSGGNLHGTIPGEYLQEILLLASGAMPAPIPPRPRCPRTDFEDFRSIPPSRPSLASGVVSPNPPRPIFASGKSAVPKPPRHVIDSLIPQSATARHRPAIIEATASSEHSLCSGLGIFAPQPPRPILA